MPGVPKPKTLKTFTVKRYLIEYYEVEAFDRKYVKDSITGGPSRIYVTKEVIKMKKP